MEVKFSPWKAKGVATPRRWLSQYTQCSPSALGAGDSDNKKKKKRRGGAHSDVFIVQSTRQRAPHEKRRFYAIKRQALISAEAKNRAVREQKIAEELKKLVYRSMCGNFVLLHDWNSCETYVEPGFATPSRSASSTSSSSSSSPSPSSTNLGWLGGTPTKAPTTPQSRGKRSRSLRDYESPAKYEFMHFVLEYGEKTLANCLKEVDLAQYREILWQVLYALHVAGKTFSFSHYDLHHKNILLCSLPMEDGCYVYYHEGVAYYNQTCIVKIADFGLSRITTEEGETLCNTKNTLGQEYSPDVDVMSVVGWPWKNLDPNRGNDPNHKELQGLQRLMRKGVRPAVLLNHPFFAPLKEAPASFSPERCVAVSTEGLEGIPKDLHARALATCAPPTPSTSRFSAGSSTASPTTKSPSGFIVPASPYHIVGPSGLRRSFVKPPQPFTPSSTAKLADHEEPDDLKEGEPTSKRPRPTTPTSHPTTPTSYPTTPTSHPTTPRSSVEASKPEGTPSQPAAEVRKVVRLAKRKRPPPPSFLAAGSSANKENEPNQRSENTNNKNNETTKKARPETAADDESDTRDPAHQARRSGRAKKTVSSFSPSAKPKVALSSRRKAVTR